MAKTMFQISGAADGGAITAVLQKPSGDKIDLSLDKSVELTDSGDHLLVLDVPGFVPINIPLSVQTGAATPSVEAKEHQLPVGCQLIRQRFKEIISSEQSDWLFLLSCGFAHPRELVLVAGIESGRAGTDFDLFAHTRRKDQTSKVHKSIEPAADQSTIVTHFSFATGKRKSYMLRSPTRWMVVDEEDHGRPAPREQRPEGLSITHVYDWVIAAGKALPGRVVEFSIFGHAWKQGPILLGTDDILRDKIKRDPNDHDCRIKDFNGQVMDVDAFAKAFSAKAQNHVFGCYGNLLYKWCARVLQHPKPSDPNKTFVVRKKNGSRGKMTWDACHAVVDKALVKNYSYALAVATGCPTWAGTPGAGSSFARKGRRHYCEMDMRAFGIYVKAVAKTFELEHDDQWYVKYVVRESKREAADSNQPANAYATPSSAATSSEPRQSPASQQAEGIEVIDPTADLKQYVNLPTGTSQGRIIRVEAKITPPTAGTDVHWSFEGTSHLGGQLPVGKAGFANAQTPTAVTKTDFNGVAAVEFHLSHQGGDTFRVSAGLSAYGQGSSSAAITVWRKLYYELDTMKGSDGAALKILDQHSKLHTSFNEVFIKLVKKGTDQHPNHQLNIMTSRDLHTFTNRYFSAVKSPFQVHITGIDHNAVKKTSELLELKLNSALGVLPDTLDGWLYDGKQGQHWVKVAKYKEPGGVWTDFNKNKVKFGVTRGYGAGQIAVDFRAGPVTPSPTNIVDIKLQYCFSNEYAGDATYDPHVVVADGGMRQIYPQSLLNGHALGTMVHEIGHLLGMVPTTSTEHIRTSGGHHCKRQSCVMYKALHNSAGQAFCSSCTKALLSMDLAQYEQKFRHSRGPNS
jgi:hypothetical protein